MYTLRPYQKDAVGVSRDYFLSKTQKKPVLLVEPTGCGKSLIIANIAQGLDAPLLVFQPTKEILNQNYNKMADYNIQGVTIYSASMRQKEIGNITLATIGSVYRKTDIFKQFKYILVDECFPKGTLIDGIPIEKIKEGDMVRSYNHHGGGVEYKRVKATSKRKVKSNLIKVNLSNGISFVCTENHPIYTIDYGYISAYSLSLCKQNPLVLNIPFNEPQEDLALQDMWSRMPSTESRQNKCLLQSRMCLTGHRQQENKNNDKLFFLWKGIRITRDGTEKRTKNGTLLLFKRVQQSIQNTMGLRPSTNTDVHKGIKGTSVNTDENQQSNVVWGQQRSNDRENEGKNFSVSWWKRRTDQTTTCFTGDNGTSNRICDRNSRCEGFISKFTTLLQGRLSRSIRKISYRGRREDTQIKEVEISRQKKNGSPQLIRVDGCEILERGNRREFESVCRDGYVYNIEVEDNHNYFVNNILVHNCDLVNSKGGMYKSFLESIGEKHIGLTATPYRMNHDGYGGTMMKFLTRTNPRMFSRVIHVTQTRDLLSQGFLAKTDYFSINGFNRSEIRLNSTGADYQEESERQYYDKHSFDKKIIKVVNRLLEIGKTRILVFTKFVHEAESLSKALGDVSAVVHGEMNPKERDAVIKDFRSGKIKVVTNCAVLTTGFDYPELETVVVARPTRSLRLWYQMTGRVVRPNLSDPSATKMVVDMCNNYEVFGGISDMEIVERGGDNLWCVMSKGKQLTNKYLDEIMKN